MWPDTKLLDIEIKRLKTMMTDSLITNEGYDLTERRIITKYKSSQRGAAERIAPKNHGKSTIANR